MTYKNLPVGSYIFYAKSQDETGNTTTASITVEITVSIAPPKEKDGQPPITSSLLTLANSEVTRIAISSYGNIIYALDATNAKIYKSEFSGFGWTNIAGSIAGAATWDAMAIAPDYHSIIAVATNAGTEVYLSVEGVLTSSPAN